MGYVAIDVRFPERHEVCSLSDKAFRLHFDAILYAEQFDLWVLPSHITSWLRRRNRCRNRHIDELVTNELWIPCAEGHQIARLHRPRQERRPFISRAVRFAIYMRDGNVCVICGASERLTLDHIHPFSAGGSDHPDNLRTLCHSCNSRRGAGRISDEELRRGR